MPFLVLCFGDSLTEGKSMRPEEQSLVWPKVVEQLSQGKFRLLNEGLGGRPTDSLPDFLKALNQHGDTADVLVIALGGNDARDVSGNCVPNALKNIREMIRLARASRSNLPILLVGPANIRKDTLGPSKPIANEREQNLLDLNAAYLELAGELNCYFTSWYDVVPPESLEMDGVHPDATGNRPLAEKILQALERLTAM